MKKENSISNSKRRPERIREKKEWLKKEKTTMIEQRKEYINYIKVVMQKKGVNPKLWKDKFLLKEGFKE